MKHVKSFSMLLLFVSLLFVLTACKTHVENKEYTIEYNSKTYDGKYTGTFESNKPVEEGKFYFGNEGDNNYFIYEGTWEAGEMKGKGTLVTNNYIVHFPKADSDDTVDKVGQYNGSVIDGEANGEGTFSAVNSEGVSYTYTGEWKDGLFNGEGKVVYDSEDYWVEEGNFENGDFKPTPVQLMKTIGTDKSICEYQISDNVETFLIENEDVIVGHKTKVIKDLIDKEFNLEKFKKSPSVEKPYFIDLRNILVHQVTESSSDDMYGYDFTETLCQDNSIRPYRLYYFGHSEKLAEGKQFDAIVLPLNYSTYDTVDGGKEWALVGWIVKIK